MLSVRWKRCEGVAGILGAAPETMTRPRRSGERGSGNIAEPTSETWRRSPPRCPTIARISAAPTQCGASGAGPGVLVAGVWKGPGPRDKLVDEERSMRFTLKNLGRLEEATIDLSRDLIVLTGPNNTSKTYVAYAIYGFVKTLPYVSLNNITDLLGSDYQFSDEHVLDKFSAFLRDNLDTVLEQINKAYKSSLADVFAADDSFTSRAEVTLKIDEREINESAKRLATPGLNNISLVERVIRERMTGIFAISIPAALKGSSLDKSFYNDISRHIISHLLFAHKPHIMTAERSAIQLFGRELAKQRSDLVDSVLAMTARGSDDESLLLLRRQARRYSMPIRDGLRDANDLAVQGRTSSPLAHLAEHLGRGVIQGSIRIGKDGDMAFHPDGSGASMDMSLASSSVKALSSLSFYLGHLAQVGDFLIIDEPELNLHPDNQRRVAKLLVRIARSGVKVMISTHSDYVIREINNAIMLSADEGGELRRKYGYEEDDTITPDRVGAYLFDQTRAHPIEIKPTGIEVETIEREINSLNASSQDIYFSLFHGRES
jgi:hypothetical protein